MIFDFLFSTISITMFCFCISSALIPERKYSYTILCTPLTFTELAIFTDPFFINNFLLIILICITHACMLYIYKYKAVLYSISTTLLFLTALFFVNLLYVRLLNIFNLGEFYGLPFGILYCMISLGLLKILKYNRNNLSFLEENKTFGLIGIVLLVLISLLMHALSFIRLPQSTIILMTVLVFVLSLLFLFLFFQYRQNYLEKEKLRIQRENNDRINHIYDSLLKKEHRMLYVLRKLDHVISDEETHLFIEKEIDDLMHKQFVSHTNNPIFDHRLTLLMQSLEDYDIKMIVMIPVDSRLDNTDIIEQMEIFIREHVTDHTEIRLKVKDNQFIINCNDKTKSIRLKTPH